MIKNEKSQLIEFLCKYRKETVDRKEFYVKENLCEGFLDAEEVVVLIDKLLYKIEHEFDELMFLTETKLRDCSGLSIERDEEGKKILTNPLIKKDDEEHLWDLLDNYQKEIKRQFNQSVAYGCYETAFILQKIMHEIESIKFSIGKDYSREIIKFWGLDKDD